MQKRSCVENVILIYFNDDRKLEIFHIKEVIPGNNSNNYVRIFGNSQQFCL